ncbi:MAG: hypothetical protein ACRCXN_13045 [Bacteroidales bacterium]
MIFNKYTKVPIITAVTPEAYILVIQGGAWKRVAYSDFITTIGYTPENAANKGQANGYASLGSDSKVPASQSQVASVAGKTGAVSLVKADVGLGDVDNTSDLNKPISTATQTALDAKASAAVEQTWTAKQIFMVAPQFDSTTANAFLKVDSGKQVTSYNPARGQFDMTTPANVTTVSNAYTKVLGTTAASELQDITHPTSNRLVIANAGTYRISVSGSLQASSNNRTYDIAIYLNGITRLASQGFRVTVANMPFNFALDRIKTLAQSDFIEIYVQERGNSSTITTPDLNLNVMQLI